MNKNNILLKVLKIFFRKIEMYKADEIFGPPSEASLYTVYGF
jgi:hypothetical protein